MKHLPIFLIIGLILFCACGCRSKSESKESNNLAQYRDTLIRNFNGLEIDTLICEPMDSLNPNYKGFHYKWRVFTKNKTVKDLILENKTIGIHFVYEADLDGNGTDEWGYVTEWETSNWMCYHAFTNKRGKWEHIIEPTNIWLPHLDPQDSISYRISKEDILQPS
jgi:lipoprotein